ncbi:hypothetical protein V8G54_032129 [Vigna mungo]|uniref:Uncharacterized protein n=1 Tax=Vigna mungo TaxID=3915 RepID=A0AAQ3RGE5_VIGMU
MMVRSQKMEALEHQESLHSYPFYPWDHQKQDQNPDSSLTEDATVEGYHQYPVQNHFHHDPLYLYHPSHPYSSLDSPAPYSPYQDCSLFPNYLLSHNLYSRLLLGNYHR